MKERMILFNFMIPVGMAANLDLVKRVTGVTKGMHIRAALEPYLEKKLIENEFMIKTMDRAFLMQNRLTEKLNVGDNKGVTAQPDEEQQEAPCVLPTEEPIDKAG